VLAGLEQLAQAAGESLDTFVPVIERFSHGTTIGTNFRDALPRTPTGKGTKVQLREDGCPAGTWDHEAAGITIRRLRPGSMSPTVT
jgi:hypothetical protein